MKDEIIALIIKAQSGDKCAENDVIVMIRDKFMMRRVSKFLGKNRQVDNEDIKQEFLIGVALSIQKVSLDIGDPVEYLIGQGIFRVRSYMRKHIIQGTIQVCSDCGGKHRLNKVGNGYQCLKCGSMRVETFEINDYDEIALQSMADSSDFVNELISELAVKEFKDTLVPGTNTYALFELLEGGIDRDSSDNYIKEISKIWGSSQQNVVQNMRKLQTRYNDHVNKIDMGCVAAV